MPNQLLVGAVPNVYTKEQMQEELDYLKEKEVKVIINLMEEKEIKTANQKLVDYTDFIENFELLRFPIKDRTVPSKEKMMDILDAIDEQLKQDKKVYLHCWGGLGRTGTVVGCYLLRHGLGIKENVFVCINYLKAKSLLHNHQSPETEAQKKLILAWKINQ